jgi:hypothetical protein
MPVRVQARGESMPITLSADGSIPTEYRPTGNADVIVPWLMVTGSPRDARVLGATNPNLALRPLADDERLVAFAGDESDIARDLFPDQKLVTVQLDLSRPVLDPAQAWEVLDAIVLSPAVADRVTDAQREMLASAGVILAIRSRQPPDARWPWKQHGDYWVLRHDPVGSIGIIEPSAYAPTYGWERGWPTAFRRQLLVAAAVFVLLAVAVTLWRSKWTSPAFVALCALWAGVLVMWNARRSPVLTLSGGVMVLGDHVAQVDVWHWLSPIRATDAQFPIAGLCHPILPDPKHADQIRLRLICGPDGSPQAFSFHLERGQSLAFLTRLLRTDVSQSSLQPVTEPLKSFAQELYLRDEQEIAGQFRATDPQTGEAVPVVVIAPKPPQ